MASPARRLAHNAPGPFYVDSSCIDCDTCRWMAPSTFARREGQSSVAAQPTREADEHRALMALLSCPTSSIGTTNHLDVKAAQAALPDLIADDVYHMGYHAESSYGATSYLVVRERGNVMVDSPRFTGPLVKRLEALGGIDTLFLTHRDDVADHARFARHFDCERILHSWDVSADTQAVERQLVGTDPIRLEADLLAIPVPGHTRGSMCLLYGEHMLFSGDHVAWSPTRNALGAFRSVCWYDWGQQIASMRRLREHAFEWILPGHGRRCRFPRAEMRRRLDQLIAEMGRSAG